LLKTHKPGLVEALATHDAYVKSEQQNTQLQISTIITTPTHYSNTRKAITCWLIHYS